MVNWLLFSWICDCHFERKKKKKNSNEPFAFLLACSTDRDSIGFPRRKFAYYSKIWLRIGWVEGRIGLFRDDMHVGHQSTKAKSSFFPSQQALRPSFQTMKPALALGKSFLFSCLVNIIIAEWARYSGITVHVYVTMIAVHREILTLGLCSWCWRNTTSLRTRTHILEVKVIVLKAKCLHAAHALFLAWKPLRFVMR